MTNNDWPEPQTAETHLGKIEYRDIGSGPVIVFLHLVLAEASHWDKMPPLLADRYRCIIPTLPMGAHSLPANEDADLSVKGLARSVADLLQHLDVTDVTLVGNDSGGAISQVMAVHYPERLGRVVLTNCDMYEDFPPKVFGYLRLLPHIPGAMSILGPTLRIRLLWPLPMVFGWLTNDIDGVKIDRWADALSASKLVQRDAAKVMKAFHPNVTKAAAESLKSTSLPFLVAWGEDDKAFKPSLAQRFCHDVPTARLEMIKDCKTLVCWDQPEVLAKLISNMIEKSA